MADHATKIATATMLAALPEGVPAPFLSMGGARFLNRNTITADVVLFDGLPATARFNKWALGWSYGWDDMPGGDISFEDGKWIRVARSAA